MATRAERAKSEAQKTHRGGRVSTKKPSRSEWSHDKAQAGSKAKSANRVKADAAQEHHRGGAQGRPHSWRARRARGRPTSGARDTTKAAEQAMVSPPGPRVLLDGVLRLADVRRDAMDDASARARSRT